MVEDYNDHLDRFRFNEAAKSLYDFTNDFCDWYIEISRYDLAVGMRMM